MKLRKVAIVILICAAMLALVSYESYQSNAKFVNKLRSNPESAKMFSELEPGIPVKSQVTGFFAVMLSAAGLRLLMTSYSRAAPQDGQDKMLGADG